MGGEGLGGVGRTPRQSVSSPLFREIVKILDVYLSALLTTLNQNARKRIYYNYRPVLSPLYGLIERPSGYISSESSE